MPRTALSQAEAYQRRPGRAVAERSRSRRPSAAVERPKGQMLTRGSVPKIRLHLQILSCSSAGACCQPTMASRDRSVPAPT